MKSLGASPALTLSNGVQLPALGFGVFRSAPEQTVGAVEAALAHGYRLIDTAAAYLNEREVGEAIVRSGVARNELFVQTKLWISDYGCARDRRLQLQPEASRGPHRTQQGGAGGEPG